MPKCKKCKCRCMRGPRGFQGPTGTFPPFTPGSAIVYLADSANGGNDSNSGLTESLPKETLPAALDVLRGFSADEGIVEIVGPSVIDITSTPTIDLSPIEGNYTRIIIRGQRVVSVSGTTTNITRTNTTDFADPRFRWATITSSVGLVAGAHEKQFFSDDTLGLVFAIHSNTISDINLTGGYVGPWAFPLTTGSGNAFSVYTNQAVFTATNEIVVVSKHMPLTLESLTFRTTALSSITLGAFKVRGAAMTLHMRGCNYSPGPNFNGPIQASSAFEGCVLETRSPGTPTGYASRFFPSQVATHIITNSYIDNATTQPSGAQIRLLGSYFDIGTFLQFLNCYSEVEACWFANSSGVALAFASGSTARMESCLFDSCGVGLDVETSSNVLANDSIFENCGTFANCRASSSLRMRRNTFTTSTGVGIDYREGSQGALMDCTVTGAGNVSIQISEAANVSVEASTISSSTSHAIHVMESGSLHFGGLIVEGSGGDAIRLEVGSDASGGTISDGTSPAAGLGFHVIYLGSGSEAALDTVPAATSATAGNDYRVGSLGTVTKALVSAGAPSDVNDAFGIVTPIESCNIYTP